MHALQCRKDCRQQVQKGRQRTQDHASRHEKHYKVSLTWKGLKLNRCFPVWPSDLLSILYRQYSHRTRNQAARNAGHAHTQATFLVCILQCLACSEGCAAFHQASFQAGLGVFP